jgi:hypothetical protein
MQQLSGLLKSDLMKQVAIGLGVSILVPMAVTALAPVVRPLARSTLKAGILAFEKGREVVAELGEVIDDLVAEVHEEMQEAKEREAALAQSDTSADADVSAISEER